jgi:hypothetical protein
LKYRVYVVGISPREKSQHFYICSSFLGFGVKYNIEITGM